MNILDYITKLLNGAKVEWKPLWEVTYWDKRFNGIDNRMQPIVLDFKHVSAESLKKMKSMVGNIKLLATGVFDGYTTIELADNNINEGEVITIPSGGSANIKYFSGNFVDSGNILCSSSNDKRFMLKYIFYYLVCINDIIESKFNGSAVKHPNMREILQIPIPIPPLPVQEEIVRILDTFTELTAELTARKKQYNYYRNNLLNFDDGYGAKILNGAKVEWQTLGEVADFYGGLSGKNKSDFENGNAHYISYKNIFNNIKVNFDKLDSVKVSISENQNQVKYGDILFTGSSETPEEVGISSSITAKFDNDVYLNSFSFGVRFKENIKIIPEFSKYLFRSKFMRDEIIKTASGVTRFNVSKIRFKKIEIPIPPLPVQEEIVRILDKFDALTNSITEGLPREIKLRQQQYEYYRNLLLSFPKA